KSDTAVCQLNPVLRVYDGYAAGRSLVPSAAATNDPQSSFSNRSANAIDSCLGIRINMLQISPLTINHAGFHHAGSISDHAARRD
ncbi:hypothetical protein, partial [Pseudomonas kulmbachensis]